MDPYQQLRQRFHKLSRLRHALTFLQWDQMVMMPTGGNEPRSEAIAELTAMHHEILTARETGELLEKCAEQTTEPALLQSIVEMQRKYLYGAALPSKLVKAKSIAGSKCEHGWREQRKNNDWPGFLKNFQEVVGLAREEAQARFESRPGKFSTPYDAMLDLYCTGDSSNFISNIFATLKKELPNLVQQIVEKQRTRSLPTLRGHYPIERQQRLCRELMVCLGFDFSCGRIDVSAHPFSTGCRGDHRITTRFRETDFIEALLATAHETGHASYESGLPKEWDKLPVGQARNMCIHESQSLLFEKQLFLSRPFISFFTKKIHQLLPTTEQFDDAALWAAATRVQPSFIRVEADEVTYPLHIILRYEIESGLINNTVAAEDIPELWDGKMKKYLNLSTAGDYRDGCLQDIHWTDGSFGYFPSYTIGALNSAQLFSAIVKNFPDWQQRLACGDIVFVRKWLTEAIWSKGSTMDSQDIICDATGTETDPGFFLRHIRNRYLEESC